MTDGDSVEVTCGSLTIDVLVGPVVVGATAEVRVDVPSGAEAIVDHTGGSLVKVRHRRGREAVRVRVSSAGLDLRISVPPDAGVDLKRKREG